MNLKINLFDENRGVSPVIGVILMVAITVILAAVIATFVMNMGPKAAKPANAQWEWQQKTDSVDSDPYIELSHAGGEAATAGDYIVKVSWKKSGSTGTQDLNVGGSATKNYGADAELTASDTLRIYGEGATSVPSSPPYSVQLSGQASGTNVNVGDITKIELIWKNPNNDQTDIVETWKP